MSLTLQKQELEEQLARTAAGSTERPALEAQLREVEKKLSAGGECADYLPYAYTCTT